MEKTFLSITKTKKVGRENVFYRVRRRLAIRDIIVCVCACVSSIHNECRIWRKNSGVVDESKNKKSFNHYIKRYLGIILYSINSLRLKYTSILVMYYINKTKRDVHLYLIKVPNLFKIYFIIWN